MLQTSEGRFPLPFAPSIGCPQPKTFCSPASCCEDAAKPLPTKSAASLNRFLLDVLPFFGFNTRGADGHAIVAAGTATATVHEPVLRVEDGARVKFGVLERLLLRSRLSSSFRRVLHVFIFAFVRQRRRHLTSMFSASPGVASANLL